MQNDDERPAARVVHPAAPADVISPHPERMNPCASKAETRAPLTGPGVYRPIGMGSDGSHFFSDRGKRSDAYRVSVSDEGQRAGEKWPRPEGLRAKSGQNPRAASTSARESLRSRLALAGLRDCNAARSYRSIHPSGPPLRPVRSSARATRSTPAATRRKQAGSPSDAPSE